MPAWNNEDTLFITGEGTYQCKVIDPTSYCPMDTTVSSLIVIDCDPVSVSENKQVLSWSIYPNPASEIITIELAQNMQGEEIRIYNALGQLTKAVTAASTTPINVADLPSGYYYIRVENHPQAALKFIKQ